jgi:predicted esterase
VLSTANARPLQEATLMNHTLEAVVAEALRRYDEGDFRGALKVIDQAQAASILADHPARAAYWRLCLLTRLGEQDKALRVFEAAVADGRWVAEQPLRTDPDLAGLQGDPTFERLVAVCRQRAAQAAAGTSPQALTLPATPAPHHPSGLLITLHGAGGTAAGFAEHWRAATAAGWAVLLPQSSQPARSDGDAFHWDDQERAAHEVANHYATVRAQTGVDERRVVLAGFSQGASVAMALGLSGVLPARAFLAVAPSLRDADALVAAATGGQGTRRGLVIVGDHDTVVSVAQAHEMAERLRALAVVCELEVQAGLGHGFPPRFGDELPMLLSRLVSE